MNPRNSNSETLNLPGLFLWLGLVTICLALYFIYPQFFSPQYLRQFFTGHLFEGLTLYFIISTLRGFTLVPSTPLVLAGVLVFPPWPLFLVNQAAVYTSSAIVYFMARYVRFDHFFMTHYEKQTIRLMALLHRRELPVIAIWGFAPMVPSDMIVYVCSSLRISVVKTLIGISIGEGAICALYIFAGAYSLSAISELL